MKEKQISNCEKKKLLSLLENKQWSTLSTTVHYYRHSGQVPPTLGGGKPKVIGSAREKRKTLARILALLYRHTPRGGRNTSKKGEEKKGFEKENASRRRKYAA